MTPLTAKDEVIRQLQKEVHSLQRGGKHVDSLPLNIGLGPIETAFPCSTFPLGAVHEFISYAPQDVAATNGFISNILSNITQHRYVVWVGQKQRIYPPALSQFGIRSECVIFANISRHTDALWTIEEALKCDSLAAVIGEIGELTFTQSRRLQLAVEQSHVTGFIHRHCPRTENTTACVTRWKITPLPSETIEGMPGLGFSRWNVELLKVRNGSPGVWQVECTPDGIRHLAKRILAIPSITKRKTG
jgi:protein ImuA